MADGGAPVPRGRGAALLAALKKKKEEAAQAVGVQPAAPPEEPPKPKGRAALLMKAMQAKKLGQVGAAPPVTAPPVAAPPVAAPPVAAPPVAASPVVAAAVEAPKVSKPTVAPSSPAATVEAVTKKVAEVTITEQPKEVAHYKGESGKPLNLSANFIRLNVEKGRGVFEYEVIFEPELDAKNQRIRMVNQMMREINSVKVFDGGHQLYLPQKITDTQKTYTGVLPGTEQEVTITIIYKREKSLGDRECLHLYNVLFKRIMHELLFTQMGRNYFDPAHRHLIPQHKLEVYPGFAVTVDELEDGLMLCLDTQHRVLRTQNAYELLHEIRCASDPRAFKENALKSFLGSCVFTRYNNKTYIIDDILWDLTPKDTFPTRDGQSITFIEYYKVQHNIVINDHDQPLLLNRKSVKVSGSAQKEDRMVCLIPEVSYLTGLTDAMRSDFRVMKDVAVYTRVTPQQRVMALRTYLQNVQKSEKAQQILANWGLSIAKGNLELAGRQLETETIFFGNQITKSAGPGADWNRDLANNPVTGPVDLRNWAIFFCQQDTKYAGDFAQHMQRLASSMGCRIDPPRMEKLPNDQTSTYINYVSKKIDRNVQVAVFICPTMRSDRYAIIKKLCSATIPIASQVINSKTLSKPDKVRAIILKIALQINCKLGGSLWTVRFPFKGWMICGIDVYHGTQNDSVCGFVSSLNESITRWYSTALFQSKELGDFYKMAFKRSLEQYKNECGNYPSKIIIIRDGVGDGQLEYTKRYEVEQFESVLKAFGFETTICFIVVQKRINTRMFHFNRGQVENPPPGTILDHTVTRRYLYDFFMVPQSVRQGTVNPTHYIVLHNTCQLKPDHVQRLCYKLCHLYYNWPGTIRVPAPCQYAHKLAAMVGQQLKTLPAPELADKLWYL